MANRPVTPEVVDGQGAVVIDPTLPPTSSYEMLAAEGATVLVFSHDATLARVIRNVAADRYPIRIIEAWNDLLQQVGSGKGRIVLLDADAVSSDVEDALAEINRCSDWLVTIIAAKQQQAQDFMRFWSERRIHRLLIKPAAAGITRLLLESAFARFIELRELHENTDSMEIPQELVEAEQERERSERRRRASPLTRVLRATFRLLHPRVLLKLGTVAIVAGGVLFASGYIVEWFSPSQEMAAGNVGGAGLDAEADAETTLAAAPGGGAAAADPAAGSQPTAADAEDEAFTVLLQQARTAEDQGRFARPDGDNAIDHYTAVLAQAPNHVLARDRLDAILERLFMTAEEQILRGEFAAAAATLDDIQRGNPSGTRWSFLSEQLAQMRQASAELDAARRAAPVTSPGAREIAEDTAPQAELQSIVTLAQLRLTEGALVAPAGDSARDYLLRALNLGLGSDQLQPLADEFVGQCLTAIPQALSQGNVDAATMMLNTARELGGQAGDLSALATEIDSAVADRSRALDDSLHQRALQSIGEGNFSGSEDSAAELLTALRSRGAEAAIIADVEARLTNALSQSIRGAIGAGRWDAANTLLGVFETAELDSNVVRGLQRDLTIARTQSELLETAAPVGEMTLLESVPAEYPRTAVTAGITGWVELNFTVDRSGATRDISVVAAEPADRFEEAAIEAVEQYRFEPFVLDSRAYERRVRLRMRFELD